MSQTYKVLQSDIGEINSVQEKDNSYFNGLNWKKVETCFPDKILNNSTDADVRKQANRLGNILNHIYTNESSNNSMVNLTEYQFKNNYNIKPYEQYGIGDPTFSEYCISYNNFYFKPNTKGMKNSDRFDISEKLYFKQDNMNINENPYKDCEDIAIRNNVPYFIVGDMSYIDSSATYNCYVPKYKNSYNTNVIKKLINPLVETINTIFSSRHNIISESLTISSILDASKNLTSDYYIKDSSYNAIPGVGNYLIYTTDVYNFSINNNASENYLQNFKDIQMKLAAVNSHTYYQQLYDNSLSPSHMIHFFDDLKTNFTNFRCLPSMTSNITLDEATSHIDEHNIKVDNNIHDIYNKYELLNETNKNIENDISTIQIVSKDREKYLRELYKAIEAEQIKLKELLNNSNGGIGRLKDQKYLRDNTIIEINILILIIIFSLFLYSKIK